MPVCLTTVKLDVCGSISVFIPTPSLPHLCLDNVAMPHSCAAEEGEISFDPGDIIENIEKVDEGWWIGSCRGARGLFPSNYVELQ